MKIRPFIVAFVWMRSLSMSRSLGHRSFSPGHPCAGMQGVHPPRIPDGIGYQDEPAVIVFPALPDGIFIAFYFTLPLWVCGDPEISAYEWPILRFFAAGTLGIVAFLKPVDKFPVFQFSPQAVEINVLVTTVPFPFNKPCCGICIIPVHTDQVMVGVHPVPVFFYRTACQGRGKRHADTKLITATV